MSMLWGVVTARVLCFSTSPVGVSLSFVLLSNSLKIYVTKLTWNYITLQLRQARSKVHVMHEITLIFDVFDAIFPHSNFKKDPARTPTNDLEGVLGWELPLGVRLIFSFLSCTLAYRVNINARWLSILRVLIQLIYSALRSTCE